MQSMVCRPIEPVAPSMITFLGFMENLLRQWREKTEKRGNQDEDRSGKEQAVEGIEDSASARNERTGIFDASGALESAFDQITHDDGKTQGNAKENWGKWRSEIAAGEKEKGKRSRDH